MPPVELPSPPGIEVKKCMFYVLCTPPDKEEIPANRAEEVTTCCSGGLAAKLAI